MKEIYCANYSGGVAGNSDQVIVGKGRNNMSYLTRFMLGSILVVSVTLLPGCYRVSHYSGDGQLIDNGPYAATDRFVINFGSIDLTKQGTRTFRLSNLPDENFVAGIEISVVPEDRYSIEMKLVNPTISLELSGPGGKVMFMRKMALDAWTWAVPVDGHRAFAYGRREPGTFFNAVPETEYTLTLNVLEPDRSNSKYTALLIAKSGGWK